LIKTALNNDKSVLQYIPPESVPVKEQWHLILALTSLEEKQPESKLFSAEQEEKSF